MASPLKRKTHFEPLLLPDEELPPLPDEGGQDPAVPLQSGQKKRRQQSAALGIFIQLILVIVGIAVLAFPTFILLFGGLLPTFVAILVDDKLNRHRLITIGAFNLSGVVMFLVPLWASGHTVHHALQMMSDVYTWAVMYMAAGAGVAALWLGPQIAAVVANAKALREKRRLENMRAALLDEWGLGLVPDGELPPDGFDKQTGSDDVPRSIQSSSPTSI